MINRILILIGISLMGISFALNISDASEAVEGLADIRHRQYAGYAGGDSESARVGRGSLPIILQK